MTSLTCRAVREGLTEYLENALSTSDRQGYETHLAGCAECRDSLLRMRSLIERVSLIPREDMSSDMRERLRRAFRDRAPGPSSPDLPSETAEPVSAPTPLDLPRS